MQAKHEHVWLNGVGRDLEKMASTIYPFHLPDLLIGSMSCNTPRDIVSIALFVL